jgi:hypothetical protein
MNSATTDPNVSVLDVMKWSHLAKAAGTITEAEWREANALVNRVAFARDHEMPAFVTVAEQARFEELTRKVMPKTSELLMAFQVLRLDPGMMSAILPVVRVAG